MTKEEAIEVFEMKIELEPENEDIYNMAIKALEQQDKTEKLLAVGVLRDCESCKAEQSRWIPISERLPEDYETVLIQFVDSSNGISMNDYDSCELSWMRVDGSFVTQSGRFEESEILAWMPLPEPYKRRRKNDIYR